MELGIKVLLSLLLVVPLVGQVPSTKKARPKVVEDLAVIEALAKAEAKKLKGIQDRIQIFSELNSEYKAKGFKSQSTLSGPDFDNLIIDTNQKVIPSADQIAERTRFIMNQGFGAGIAQRIATAEVKYQWLEGLTRFNEIAKLIHTPSPHSDPELSMFHMTEQTKQIWSLFDNEGEDRITRHLAPNIVRSVLEGQGNNFANVGLKSVVVRDPASRTWGMKLVEGQWVLNPGTVLEKMP